MNLVRKPKESKLWPQRIYLVAALPETDNHSRLYAAMWMDQDFCRMVAYEAGNCSFVEKACSGRWAIADTLIIAESAYQWTLDMGFWPAVKSGRIRLKGVDERRPSSPRCIVEEPPTIIQWGVPGRAGSAVICDPRNWGWALPSADERRDIPEYSDTSSEEAIVAHLWQRVNVLAEWVAQYRHMLAACDLGPSWRCTAGSQAYYGYRRHYMDVPIEASTPGPAETMVSKATYGGRCECFRLGRTDGPIYQFDANQLYSWVASELKVPTLCLGQLNVPLTAIKDRPLWDTVADCTIKTDYPGYPYRTGSEGPGEKDSIVIYPIGEYRTVLAGPELELARAAGRLLRIHAAYYYDLGQVLQTWAHRMWQYRCDADGAYVSMVKAMALSLYGKFGQRRREWLLDNEPFPVDDVEVGDWYECRLEGPPIRHRVLCGQSSSEIVDGYMPQSSPPIHAWITSMGRVALAYWMGLCPDLYYVDTDSIWCGPLGAKALQDNQQVGPTLGQLRLCHVWDWVEFQGVKNYVVEGRATRAGVPDGATPLPGGRMRWDSQQRFDSSMAERQYPTVRRVVRAVRGTELYRHGIVLPDGRVEPHCLEYTAGQ